jgi:hypothetical protein
MNTKGVMAMSMFVLLIILATNPMKVNSIYSTILGRIVLIGLVVYCSMNNITLGLLVALAIIASINQFGSFVEGMDTMAAPVTIGEDNVSITGKQIVLTKSATSIAKTNSKTKDTAKQTISDLKAQADGVDKEAIRNTIMSKDSKTIQIDPDMMKNEDVNAYNPSMLTNTASMTEGFCSCAAAV